MPAKASAEPKESKSERKKLSKIITDLMRNAYTCTGSLRPYDDIESDFNTAVGCPIIFSQNKYAAAVFTIFCSLFILFHFRGHLAAAYKRYQLDLLAGPSAEFALLSQSRIPYIKAYEKLITAIFLHSDISSVRCKKNAFTIGDVHPRLYALGLFFLSASGMRRQKNDSMVALCLSGPSSFGKSMALDSALTQAKIISQDSRGVGRYAGGKSNCTFYFSDICVSDILGHKSDFTTFKHLARGEPNEVKNNGGSELCG
jgi:hypothetical protein